MYKQEMNDATKILADRHAMVNPRPDSIVRDYKIFSIDDLVTSIMNVIKNLLDISIILSVYDSQRQAN